MKGVLLVAAILAPVSARADDVRGRGFTFDFHAGGGVASREMSAAPSIQYGLGGGFAFDRAGRFAAGLALTGFNDFTSRSRHDRGSICITVSAWLTDDLAFRFGAGTQVGPEAVADGFAGFARASYAVHHWHRKSLVVGLEAHEDTTVGPQVSAFIGIELFTHAMKIDLSQR
jgi:hypothetical protein